MKAFLWTLVALALLAGLAYGGREYAARAMAYQAVSPEPLGAASPANADVPFSRVAVESDDRTLIGWWVRAPADSGQVAPALLFLHGNRSAISDYVDLVKFLYRQGISTFVFDYSGFGASGGTASLPNAVVDAGKIARVFADSAGERARKVAMGSALGATILLQAVDAVQPHVDGLVVEGVDASVLASAVRAGYVPKLAAPMLEDPADNVVAAARVRVPLLALHSYADARVPIEDAQKVVSAVPGKVSLVRHWRRGHSALLTSSRPCDWEPVLSFVRTGSLPAARLDTTNACAVEAARLAAREDSATAPADSAKGTAADPAGGRGAAPGADSAATAPAAAGAPATKADTTKSRAPAPGARATKGTTAPRAKRPR